MAGNTYRDEVERTGAWRAEVGARIEELTDRLDAVPTDPWDARKEKIKESVERRLEHAHTAAELKPGPIRWWSGSSLTKAWEAVHYAELGLMKIETDGAVETAVPRLLAWVQRSMNSGPIKEEHETTLRIEMKKEEENGKEPVPDRVKVRGALCDVIDANSQRYAGVRTFRSIVIVGTLALIAALLTIAIWYAINPFLPLCHEINGGTSKASEVCVSGAAPKSWDVWIILLIGALGGLLGFIPGFYESTDATRYDPNAWLALLKPVTGAATALAAVIFLQSGVVIELASTASTSGAIIGWALFFGISQQVLTKMVDKKAAALVTPS